MAEQHVGFAGIAAAVVATRRADDQVGETVAIDVARGADAAAQAIPLEVAPDHEALRGSETRSRIGERDHGAAAAVDNAEARGLAEHNIGLARAAAPVVGTGRADDQVGEAVAVHVADRSDSRAGGVLLLLSDMIARTLVAPAELPIGIVTALLGAPLFLWILLRRRALVDL